MGLYRVDEDSGSLTEIGPATLSGEGLQERGGLQCWLRDHPGALEPGLFTLAEEYGGWADSSRRIDLLALDAGGRLVVVELKRDEGPFMDLQAIRYAALVARMTFAQAVAAHARYLADRGVDGDAEARILEHLGAEGGAEPEIASARPRILLAARDFPRELTTAVLWLRDSGLDVRCVRLLPYRVGGALVLDAAQVIPLPEAEDYPVRIRDREAEQGQTYPDIPWTREDVERLAGLVANTLTLLMLDIFAESPEEWVSLASVRARGSEEQRADWPDARFAAGSLAGLTGLVHREFGRDNRPFGFDYREGGDSRSFRMTAEVAEWWRAARGRGAAARRARVKARPRTPGRPELRGLSPRQVSARPRSFPAELRLRGPPPLG